MTGSELPRDSENSLLCLYYPQQLLPGLAAVMSFRRHLGKNVAAPLTLLVWSHPATERRVREKRLQAFKVLLEGFTWVRLIFPEQDEVKSHLSHNSRVMRKAGYLRRKFGQDAFAAIYYAHDISADFIAQSAMQAFPNAARICFGDALGVVYSNDYFTDQTYPVGGAEEAFSRPAQTIRNILFRLKRAWTLPSRVRRLDAGHAVLILPCDPGGNFLEGKELQPVDDDSLRNVLNTLSSAAERHLTEGKGWVSGDTTSNLVMLLGSYSESRLTSEDQECALYVEAARFHALPGRKIILKAHPASTNEKVTRIEQALSAHYDIEVANNDELPIETMPWLVKHSKIISFSYSSVSLLYLHGCTVLHAMNDALINQFFPKETRQWMLESNKLYLEQLAIAKRLRSKQPEALACQK